MTFEEVYGFESLYRAYRVSRRAKRWKEAARFEIRALESIHALSEELRLRTYEPQPYNIFYVYEPKKRIVMANGYRDKVVQHALCDNILTPVFTRSFVYDNAASQIGKGSHFARDRLAGFMRDFYRHHGSDGWVLKCDISKYFYTIRHDYLKAMIRRKIDDEGVLWLVDKIIDSTEGNVGVPIGNQSSQIFALLYLDKMDHYLKEQMGVKYYGRYMDDFYIIHESKDYLNECRYRIRDHIESLGLALNPKTDVFPLKNGVDYLGFHFYLTDTGKVIQKIRNKKKSSVRRRIKKMAALYKAGQMTELQIRQSYFGWRAHALKGDTYHLVRNMDEWFVQLMRDTRKEKF